MTTCDVMSSLTQEPAMDASVQFIAIPFDLTSDGLRAGESFKCASAASAIERAKGFWQVLGHSGAVAIVTIGYPPTETTILRRFGVVPDELPVEPLP